MRVAANLESGGHRMRIAGCGPGRFIPDVCLLPHHFGHASEDRLILLAEFGVLNSCILNSFNTRLRSVVRLTRTYKNCFGTIHLRQIRQNMARAGKPRPTTVSTTALFERKATELQVIEEMVRPERFELPTFWFVARRSIQLS